MFLKILIDYRLLAAKAKEIGLDQDEHIQLKVDAYRNKCLRDAHYEKVIAPKIEYDEQDVKEAYRFWREQRRVKHLFFPEKAQADSAYRLLLAHPERFDMLAEAVFDDTTLANSGGDLGWVYWEQMEYDMGQAAFRLPLNQISQPLRSTF
ncbi:MAG: peptidylprolyl isomerase, partial [Candidatus Zixiibacteriota bacterium]